MCAFVISYALQDTSALKKEKKITQKILLDASKNKPTPNLFYLNQMLSNSK